MMIHLVAEGLTEEKIAARLLPFCGHELGAVYGGRGYLYIRDKAAAFHRYATESSGVLVLTDFRDSKMECVPSAVHTYILSKVLHPPKTFLCRFAVHEIESWLLADRRGMADFLGIAMSRLPLQPDEETFPKKALVRLARFSRKKSIREGVPPPPGHHASVGPEYMNYLSEFIANCWDIKAASCCSPSLERCVRRLKELK